MPIHPDYSTNDSSDRATDASSRDPPEGMGQVLIVDEQGQPYTHNENAYNQLKGCIKNALERIPHGERLMIILTAIIAVSTVAQIYLARVNNRSSSVQVDKLIVAANRIDDAADSFSRSSSGINNGISIAVKNLGDQAKASREFATQSQSQFSKEQRPYIWHDTLQVDDSNPSFFGINVYWTNYGKSPALRFSSTGQTFCGKDALLDAYQYLDAVKRKRSWDNINAIIPPSINLGLPTPNRGYDTFVTDPEDAPLRSLCGGPNPALPRVTVGAWEYYDLAGNRYYGEFCNGIHLGIKRGYDASGSCDKHNNME